MNDFTKQELEELIESFDWIESETSWDWKHPLRNKIQSLIDNYHECVMEYCGYVEATQCKECGKRG